MILYQVKMKLLIVLMMKCTAVIVVIRVMNHGIDHMSKMLNCDILARLQYDIAFYHSDFSVWPF